MRCTPPVYANLTTWTNLSKIKKCCAVFSKGWVILIIGFFITIFSGKLVGMYKKKNIFCVVLNVTISSKAAESVAPL